MVTRRSFLDLSARGALFVVGGAGLSSLSLNPVDRAADASPLLRNSGRVRDFTLRAGVTEWSVGVGKTSQAWAFNGSVPGPVLRVAEGDLVRVSLENALPEPTTIHWHGLPVPFAMDGVPELTQAAVSPGGRFLYQFEASVAGTYWYHSHFGYQFERGLFGTIIVDPKREPLVFDREYVLVLDDWLSDPAHPVSSVQPLNMTVGGVSMGMTSTDMESMRRDAQGTGSSSPAGMAGMSSPVTAAAPTKGIAPSSSLHASHGAPMREPVFDAYTVNGLVGRAHPDLLVRRGERLRARFINVSTATVYPIYVAGHTMRVTHQDGQPVTPYSVTALPIGMGERYDVIIEADNPGAWRIASTDPAQRAKGLEFVLRYEGLRPDIAVSDVPTPKVSRTPYLGIEGALSVPPQPIDREYVLSLRMAGSMKWTVNGKAYPETGILTVHRGERVRLRMTNNSMFAHPMHLHGHFFDVTRPYGSPTDVPRPLRKDTLTLYHMDTHAVDFTADNPGDRWFFHCHNQYHHVGGMAVEIQYI